MIKKYLYIIACAILLSTSQAYAALELVITGGVNSARPIGVVPFKWDGPGKLPQDIAKIIASDLQRSGKFSPILAADMPQQPHNEKQIDADSWIKLGVGSLLVGRIIKKGDDQYEVSCELVDIAEDHLNKKSHFLDLNEQDQTSHILLMKKATIKSKQFRVYAHKISNYVYKSLIGERGAFLTRIAYVAINPKAKYPYQLRLADYDGYDDHTIVRSKFPLMSPAWSPDGQQIVYVGFSQHQTGIYRIDIFTGKVKMISLYPRHNGAPKYSPDGKKLAIVLSKSDNLHIYTLDFISNKLVKLTSGRSNNTEPFWSRDGKELVFTSDRGGQPQLYNLNLNTKQVKRLTWNGSQNLSGQISPDGRSLIMVSRLKTGYHIVRQDLDSGAVQVLTKTRLDESPSIAPNGSMVVYSSMFHNKNILSMVSVDGRFQARLPAKGEQVRSPAWSPFL